MTGVRSWPQPLLLLACLVLGCQDRRGADGSASRGQALARTYGCHTCHVIPGVRGADSSVGPPLTGFKRRVYAGGRLNTRANLIEFLQEPRVVDERSPMPDVGVTPADAGDLAAFLYTLD